MSKAAALLLAASLAILVACRTPAPRSAPDRAPAPPDTHESVDGSYDWHGLLIAPFGSVLKEIPATLHEVLLFRDSGQSTAAPEDAECYAADAPAPRFLGRTPEEYLLCFKHDHLSRIQASVQLTTAEAAGVFAAACAGWLKAATSGTTNTAPGTTNTAPGTPDAAPATPDVASPTQDAAPPTAACQGSEGDIHFSARLEEEAGQAVLSIALDSAPDP
jgi:hypothetical protein